MKHYLETHKINRMQKGKPLTMASIVREAIFLWAKENKVTEELLRSLGQKE